MDFWQGLIIGVLTTQLVCGIVMWKARIIEQFVAFIEGRPTKLPNDPAAPAGAASVTREKSNQ
jgi:hypothetical protein